MFSKATLCSLAVMATSTLAGPVTGARGWSYGGGHDVSFHHWGGHASLDNFDSFYGADNFAHLNFEQSIIQKQELVCHSQAIEIIQQRLVVLQEMAKRVITEQICEVETQTIVFEQFHASLGGFSHDLRRNSGHEVGYDSSISGHFNDFLEEDGSLSVHDFGFSGSDVGHSVVTVGGHNWNDHTSPASVNNAYLSSYNAYPHYF